MLTLLLFVTEVSVACNSTSLRLTQTETLQLLHKYYMHIRTWVFHFCYLSESHFLFTFFFSVKQGSLKCCLQANGSPLLHAVQPASMPRKQCTCACSSSALHAKLRYNLAQNKTKGTTPFNFNSWILVIKADWIFITLKNTAGLRNIYEAVSF